MMMIRRQGFVCSFTQQAKKGGFYNYLRPQNPNWILKLKSPRTIPPEWSIISPEVAHQTYHIWRGGGESVSHSTTNSQYMYSRFCPEKGLSGCTVQTSVVVLICDEKLVSITKP